MAAANATHSAARDQRRGHRAVGTSQLGRAPPHPHEPTIDDGAISPGGATVSSPTTVPTVLPPYSSPTHPTPRGVACTQHAITGSVAPMRIFGGRRLTPEISARRKSDPPRCPIPSKEDGRAA